MLRTLFTLNLKKQVLIDTDEISKNTLYIYFSHKRAYNNVLCKKCLMIVNKDGES